MILCASIHTWCHRALLIPISVASSNTDAKYYPGFVAGQMSVTICLAACRGHGYKYAALYGGSNCYCGPIFPFSSNPGSTSGTGTIGGSAPGTKIADSNCQTTCTGNSAQKCGGGGYSALYFDPSFRNDTSAAGAATNYAYVGCYSNVNPGPAYITLTTTSTQACQAYCGSVGYSFSTRSGADTSTGTSCGCSSEVQSGLQIAESQCNTFCSGAQGAS